jgi:hypothetical protein
MMRFTPAIRPVFLAMLVMLGVGGLGLRAAMQLLDVYTRKEAVPLRQDLGSLPTKLGRWQRVGEDQQMDAAMVESLGTDKYLTRSYALDGDPKKGSVSLHLAYYTGMIDTVPHIPERCWGAGGLTQRGDPVVIDLDLPALSQTNDAAPTNAATGIRYPVVEVTNPVSLAVERVFLPVGDAAMTLTTFQDSRHPNTEQLGGYFFIANGRCTATTFGVRGLAFNISDRYAYYCKVQLSARYPIGDTPSSVAFKAQAEDFLTQLLPHLMRRLPDWPAIEQRSRGGA